MLAVGGGGTPQEAVQEALQLARSGPESPSVVVIPHASQREDRGLASAEMWREGGAYSVSILEEDAAAARAQIRAADIVWMGGGSQTRLMEHLKAQGLDQDIRAVHLAGTVVGGTSAGAAVLGEFMIAGSPDPAPYTAGAMESAMGLGLIPGVIVDQHFAERKREGRLLTALMDRPGTLGIGVSEGTCAAVQGDQMRVLGRSTVALFDGRAATFPETEPNGLRTASGITVHVVPTGSEWRIGR